MTKARDIASATTPNANAALLATFPHRNLIINGAMQVAQRGTSAVTASNNYAVDRFRTDFSTDGAFSLERSITTPADFKNSVKWTTTTADTSLASTQYAYFRQRIEGNAMSHLNWGSSDAKTITLSFYVRSSVTGTFGGAVWNNAFNRSYAFSYTISSADTWERKAITIPGDTSGTWLTDNSCGMNLAVLASAGSTYQGTAGVWAGDGNVTAAGTVNIMNTLNSTYFVTGVQLEVGDTATPFEHRSFGDELTACQRYYERVSGVSSEQRTFATGKGTSSTNLRTIFYMKTVKRASPTISGTTVRCDVGADATSPSLWLTGLHSVGIHYTTSGLSTNNMYLIYNRSGSADYIDMDAEV
jgi:hypothetical protein